MGLLHHWEDQCTITEMTKSTCYITGRTIWTCYITQRTRNYLFISLALALFDPGYQMDLLHHGEDQMDGSYHWEDRQDDRKRNGAALSLLAARLRRAMARRSAAATRTLGL